MQEITIYSRGNWVSGRLETGEYSQADPTSIETLGFISIPIDEMGSSGACGIGIKTFRSQNESGHPIGIQYLVIAELYCECVLIGVPDTLSLLMLLNYFAPLIQQRMLEVPFRALFFDGLDGLSMNSFMNLMGLLRK